MLLEFIAVFFCGFKNEKGEAKIKMGSLRIKKF
jgi:hypothetical protein